MTNPAISFVNCTPHAITVRDAAGLDTTFPPSGFKTRCETSPSENYGGYGDMLGFPVVRTVTGEVIDLPAPIFRTIYIVSSMVASHESIKGKRFDVMAPNTGPTAIRENGQVVAVRGFQMF